jgi:hypothetical protein
MVLVATTHTLERGDEMDIEGYIVAFSVGDRCLRFLSETSRLPVFRADVTSDHKDYVEWRADILRNIVTVRTYDLVHKNPNAKPLTRTETAQHELFGELRKHLYDENGKRTLTDYALSFVNWEFLAITYQEYGRVNVGKRYNKNKYPVYLRTEIYSYRDNSRLSDAIYKSTGLPFDVRSHRANGNIYWRLYLQAKYYRDFKAGIKQYIFPSFMYKLK